MCLGVCLAQVRIGDEMNKISLAFAALVVASSAHAAVITQWDFNSQTTAPSIGAGTIALQGGVTNPSFNSGTGSSDPGSPNSGLQTTTYAAQGTENGLRGVAYFVSTVGMTNITVSYEDRKSVV